MNVKVDNKNRKIIYISEVQQCDFGTGYCNNINKAFDYLSVV